MHQPRGFISRQNEDTYAIAKWEINNVYYYDRLKSLALSNTLKPIKAYQQSWLAHHKELLSQLQNSNK